MDQSIVRIVLVVDLLDDRPTRAVSEDDFVQPIAEVPCVLFDLACGRLGLRGSVPFIVKRVRESEPCRGLVVRPCRKASSVPIAVGIEAIGLIGLRCVGCTDQLRCLVVGIGIGTFKGRNDRCDPRKGVVGIGIGIEVCCPLFVGDTTETIGRIVGEVRGGHRAGCTRALVPSDLSALTLCVICESHMFREDRIPPGLTLLDDIGQTLQLIVLVGVLEVQGRTYRGL